MEQAKMSYFKLFDFISLQSIQVYPKQSKKFPLNFPMLQTTATTTLIVGDQSDAGFSTDDPLSNEKIQYRTRNRNRKCSTRRSAKPELEVNAGGAENRTKDESEDETARPKKYVRLVDRKLARVNFNF